MKRREFITLARRRDGKLLVRLGCVLSKPRKYRESAGLFLVGPPEELLDIFYTTTVFARVLMPSVMSKAAILSWSHDRRRVCRSGYQVLSMSCCAKTSP